MIYELDTLNLECMPKFPAGWRRGNHHGTVERQDSGSQHWSELSVRPGPALISVCSPAFWKWEDDACSMQKEEDLFRELLSAQPKLSPGINWAHHKWWTRAGELLRKAQDSEFACVALRESPPSLGPVLLMYEPKKLLRILQKLSSLWDSA